MMAKGDAPPSRVAASLPAFWYLGSCAAIPLNQQMRNDGRGPAGQCLPVTPSHMNLSFLLPQAAPVLQAAPAMDGAAQSSLAARDAAWQRGQDGIQNSERVCLLPILRVVSAKSRMCRCDGGPALPRSLQHAKWLPHDVQACASRSVCAVIQQLYGCRRCVDSHRTFSTALMRGPPLMPQHPAGTLVPSSSRSCVLHAISVACHHLQNLNSGNLCRRLAGHAAGRGNRL